MGNNKDFKVMTAVGTSITLILSVMGVIFVGIKAGIIIFITGALILAINIIFTKRRYSEIEKLNSYLEKVLSGDYAPEILDQKEGELSILKTNIYKATTTLKYQKELLTEDKVRLANAIADISHQLKTPLTSMMVMNDLLETEEDQSKRKEFLKTQSDQLDRMNWLIQTLLKLSKIDAGTITMKKEEVTATSIVKEIVKPFEIQMELKGINYSSFDSDMILSCDKNWTIEAIQNIVKNCIEHMEENDELKIEAEETNIYKQIIVSDTGCGIAKQDLPHIFERFYKGKNAGKDSVGIGLALAKTLISSQRGDILVESTEGIGTTFYVRFFKTII
ncbi:MAG: HAMP domain-containing histidine kinase [Butyrivibrio sp.]|jgi:signal transduction histidine kinase|uniref:sensor histidine kinase n=1 Tax=Butyrivibrio sp. TaxID=28121 RepID=UPI001EB25334|nr:HAMP domain-containing sensor histidine kinase [Butyrivibrio sp.]MBE5841458.1 HAMP domain-containing histidine kinase [Butyrivibrio sp.]